MQTCVYVCAMHSFEKMQECVCTLVDRSQEASHILTCQPLESGQYSSDYQLKVRNQHHKMLTLPVTSH
jgi:hypothetical protein